MTKAVEVITSVQRRRRWSRAEKERIVAAALEPGAIASEVARAAGILAHDRRGCDRDAGARSPPVESDPARARKALLPDLRDDHAATGPLPPDRTRPCGPQAARPCPVLQVWPA